MKLLCLATYPVETPSTRYRALQYIPLLREHGIETTFLPFMDSQFLRNFYQPRYKARKALRLMGFAARRAAQVSRARDYDAIFIQREAALFGPPLAERWLTKVARKPLIFDFDDAVHAHFESPVYGRLAALLKNRHKTPHIIEMSHSVIAGNHHLETYAKTLNPRVSMIPTVVDAQLVRPAPRHNDGKIVLGWIGTHTTFPYLETLFPLLQILAKKHPILLRVVGAGREFDLPGVEIDNRRWSLATEINDLQSFDIGLYPITPDEWSLGKSGFKAVEYMATATPVVADPVGATCDVVRDGVEGFLPASPDAWLQKLELLIEDAALRQTLGQAGRARVEEWYCLEKQAPRLAAIVREAASSAI